VNNNKKYYRIKFQERWYTAELYQHQQIKEQYFLIAGHIVLKEDCEAYYLISDEERMDEDK
jgi:hypothetical protein